MIESVKVSSGTRDSLHRSRIREVPAMHLEQLEPCNIIEACNIINHASIITFSANCVWAGEFTGTHKRHFRKYYMLSSSAATIFIFSLGNLDLYMLSILLEETSSCPSHFICTLQISSEFFGMRTHSDRPGPSTVLLLVRSRAEGFHVHERLTINGWKAKRRAKGNHRFKLQLKSLKTQKKKTSIIPIVTLINVLNLPSWTIVIKTIVF